MISCSGYMPPEYINNGFISEKFDVFSLGVIIIKMMAGNTGHVSCFEMSPKEFIELVRKVLDSYNKHEHRPFTCCAICTPYSCLHTMYHFLIYFACSFFESR